MDPIQEIKERISIEEVVSEYLSLKRAGAHLKALCPFHAEKTPSFIVSPERGTFHCFGCGKHGDIFTFLQEMEGLDFKEALQQLADKAGVDLPKTYTNKKNNQEKNVLLKIMQDAKEFYKKELKNNDDALNYLKKRAIADKTIKEFEIGFAPNGWDNLLRYLKQNGYTEFDIERAGLIKKSDRSSGYYDRFRSRIMFPIYNNKGEVVAFSGRIFGKDDEAKYINSPETEIYHKSKILYGYHKAKQAIRKFDFSIIVEGQADLLAMHQTGFANTVALSGTALSDEQISRLKRFSSNIVLALDTDEAGVAAIIKNSTKLLPLSFNIKVLALKTGEDPADLLEKEGESALKVAVKHAENLFDFLINYHRDNLKNHEKYVRVLRSRVLPLLGNFDSKVEQELAAKRLAAALGVSPESVLQDAVASKEVPQKFESTSAKAPLKKESIEFEKKLFLLKEWISELKDSTLSKEYKIKFNQELERLAKEMNISFNEDTLENKEEIFLSFDKEFLLSDLLKENLQHFINETKRRLYRDKIKKLTIKIKEAEALGKENEAEKLSLEADKLAQKISQFTN